MSVLVTGAGLVGCQVARLEAESGERVVLLDVAPQPGALARILDLGQVTLCQGDVLEPFALLRLFKEQGIRRVIHTAANPLLTAGAQRDPYPAIRLNIMGSVNILEAARLLELERVVLCSSGALYQSLTGGGDPAGRGHKEERYPRTGTFYATTKQAAENLGLNYARWFGVDFVAVRFNAVFGPWPGSGGGGAPSQALRQALEDALAGREAVLPTGITVIAEFVYSKDAALGAVLACHAQGLRSRVFNIGMGQVYTPQELADLLAAAIPGARVRLAEGPAPGRREAMDLTRAREELGYQPQYDMARALADYVATLRAWGR